MTRLRLFPRGVFVPVPACLAAIVLIGWPLDRGLAASAHPLRGLWVGQASLNYVTEVTVALDEDNNRIAPDPQVPTPTSDQAHLKLIVHVNGAGQASLLKDVAILSRVPGVPVKSASEVVDLLENPGALARGDARLSQERDIALVTDERLYTEFPPQPAIRIASVAYDFGDGKATRAVKAVMEAAVEEAVELVSGMSSSRFADQEARLGAINDAASGAVGEAEPVVESADVAKAFGRFQRDSFPADLVTGIVQAEEPATEASDALDEAMNLRDRSFYEDSRAIDMVTHVIDVAQGPGSEEERLQTAHNVASAFADARDDYHRFVGGALFGDMIEAGAEAAAAAAVADGADETSIRNAVDADKTVVEALGEAVALRVAEYDDRRATEAVEAVLDAVVDSAVTALAEGGVDEEEIRGGAIEGAREALSIAVERYQVPLRRPTLDYNAFVDSESFREAPRVAAEAAAEAAVFERANNALYTESSVRDAARVGAAEALTDIFSQAARAVRTSLPMIGAFGPGNGDPRLRAGIEEGGSSLGEAGLEATLLLPANHPTNPFRHRRHPSHGVGFDVTRKIRLDFDGDEGDSLARAGFGVDRVTGTYREEIFGLHKPLGADQNLGLRVEGRFELNRVSLIDTLNAR